MSRSPVVRLLVRPPLTRNSLAQVLTFIALIVACLLPAQAAPPQWKATVNDVEYTWNSRAEFETFLRSQGGDYAVGELAFPFGQIESQGKLN